MFVDVYQESRLLSSVECSCCCVTANCQSWFVDVGFGIVMLDTLIGAYLPVNAVMLEPTIEVFRLHTNCDVVVIYIFLLL